jgi:hypothetical protein
MWEEAKAPDEQHIDERTDRQPFGLLLRPGLKVNECQVEDLESPE